MISANEGDVKVSDITVSVTAKSGGEVTATVHGGNVALASGIDYSTIYLSNSIDEAADFTKEVHDSTDASYYVNFNAFKLSASALEDGVKNTATTILIDGTTASALKYESETTASIDGLTFAKDGMNAASPADEEKNVEFVFTGMEPANPESYRDLKKGITVGAGVTLTLDKLHQTDEKAVTDIYGELKMGIYNTGLPDDSATTDVDESIGSDTFKVVAGQVNINGGGALYDCTVLNGGTATVYKGGYVEDIAMKNGGRLDISEGGTVNNATVNDGGSFFVSSGGFANNPDVQSGGKLYLYDGGTVNNATVDDGGELFVSGGSATDIKVNAGGSLLIDSGTKLTGQMTFEDGATVIPLVGSILDFDLTQTTAGAPALVNDLSVLMGTLTYTITLDENQESGTYNLAEGAADFRGTLTVKRKGVPADISITVGDTDINGGDLTYSLTVKNNQLLFTITLDTTPPEAPIVSASVTTPTNGNVTVTADFSDDSAVKEYSLDNKKWNTYKKAIVFTDNGTVWFRGTDAAGNVSTVTTYEVKNIDKVPPEAPVAMASTADPTNKNVTVTATFSDDSVVREYSMDNEAWSAYTEGVGLSNNGTVWFRGTDEAGNVSEVASYEVTNIDKVAPKAPTAKANTTAPTNQDVTVTATFSADSAKKQYSLDNKKWNTYKKAIVLTENGKVWFRGVDAAGNVSKVTGYEVTNIDKEPPAAPEIMLSGDPSSEIMLSVIWDEDDARCFYELDGEGLKEYAKPLRFSEDAHVHLQTQDAAGNETDSRLELMFAGSPTGVWGDNYFARNCTVAGVELEPLKGRNIIGKVCHGSNDATILLLTDDGNGDALFLDDIYSAAPDIASKARLSQVNEIVAGAGDDLIDLTSVRFDYANKGLTVQGGDGNDVIWANNDGIPYSNLLFGDAGDDRIVGGSGNDIIVGGAGDDILHGGGSDDGLLGGRFCFGDVFCFGGSWGNDTVKQSDGDKTLWFDGVERKDLSLSADADGNARLSCKSGSVTLDGLKYDDALDKAFGKVIAGESNELIAGLSLQFGDSGQEMLIAEVLRSAGAFNDFSSTRGYDDSTRGMLA